MAKKPDYERDVGAITVVSHIDHLTPNEPGAAVHNACLVVISGRELGKRFKLVKKETIIGRSPQADLQFEDDAISRNHAMLRIESDGVYVRDLGSTNGSYVNDHIERERLLVDGDQIKIGSLIFKFLSGNNVEADYHEEIYRLTTTDGLTQVFNKRYFIENFEKEARRCLRHHRDLALLMMDLDHFKKINDTYGHLAGDFVLKQVAQFIMRIVRRDDIVSRYGGEEFTLFCPETDKRQAVLLAEKLRARIESERFTFDNIAIPVTISIGVADLGESVDPSESNPNAEDVMIRFIKLADDRLLEAKRRGRNAVVSE